MALRLTEGLGRNGIWLPRVAQQACPQGRATTGNEDARSVLMRIAMLPGGAPAPLHGRTVCAEPCLCVRRSAPVKLPLKCSGAEAPRRTAAGEPTAGGRAAHGGVERRSVGRDLRRENIAGGIARSECELRICLSTSALPLCGLTFEVSGRQRWDARPGLVKMYRVPPARAWWPAVGAPLERGVRRHRAGLNSPTALSRP